MAEDLGASVSRALRLCAVPISAPALVTQRHVGELSATHGVHMNSATRGSEVDRPAHGPSPCATNHLGDQVALRVKAVFCSAIAAHDGQPAPSSLSLPPRFTSPVITSNQARPVNGYPKIRRKRSRREASYSSSEMDRWSETGAKGPTSR